MKLSRYLVLGVLSLVATASPLMALQPIEVFEYDFVPTSPTSGFSPSFIDVGLPLFNSQEPISVGDIINYGITTPQGTWTQFVGFQPTLGTLSGVPFVASGEVEITSGGAIVFPGTLDIQAAQTIETSVQDLANTGANWDVKLTGNSISDTTLITPAPSDVTPGGTGAWVLVSVNGQPVSSVPEITSTMVLLFAAVVGLGVYHRQQTVRVPAKAKINKSRDQR